MGPPSFRKIGATESVLEFAHYLVDYYGADLKEFNVLMAPGECFYEYDKEGSVLTWRVIEGLDVLLHELGHHRLHHSRAVSRAEDLVAEAEAWLWAEARAHRHGVKFDYAKATKLYSNYLWRGRDRGPVKIDWRRRDGR